MATAPGAARVRAPSLVAVNAMNEFDGTCPWCREEATAHGRCAGICFARECDCGALALGAPIRDFDEVLDDAIQHYGIAPDKMKVNFGKPEEWLAESGIDFRDGGTAGTVHYFWFRRTPFNHTCPWCRSRLPTGPTEIGPCRRFACPCGAIALGSEEPAGVEAEAVRFYSGTEGIDRRAGGTAAFDRRAYTWFKRFSGQIGGEEGQVRLEAMGEAAYDRMYDESPSANYSDAKEFFREAIAVARRLGRDADAERLERRLENIKGVFRSQFG